jgi:hypothetical protein
MNQNRPFPLADFEAHAHAREHDKAMADLLGMLGQMQLGLGARGPRAMRAYTRLASAVTALFADPGFAPDTHAFGRLCVYKRTLDAVFRLSAFGGYAHLRGMLNRQTGDAAALKHMFCHALDSAESLIFPSFSSAFPSRPYACTWACSPPSACCAPRPGNAANSFWPWARNWRTSRFRQAP